MSAAAFPTYLQIPKRLSVGAWQVIRVAVLLGALGLAVSLVLAPDRGLFVLWKLVIPVLPFVWLFAPGLWRNVCPLASSNQTPRLLDLSLAKPAPKWLRNYGFLIGATLFVAFISLRRLGLDDNGPASALLLLGAMTGGFIGGVLLKGKSGWCSSICPLLPVQRLYGQTPFKLVANSHCQPCIGCTKSCYDFNPKVAFLADLNDPDEYWRGHRKLFAGLFPGLVLAFFELPEARSAHEITTLYGKFALYLAASIAAFWILDSVVKVSTHKVTTLFAAAGFSVFYWFGGPSFIAAVSGSATPAAATWAVRAAAIVLALGWIVRTYRKELLYNKQQQRRTDGSAALARVAAQRSQASRRAIGATSAPEVRVEPEGKRIVAKPGMSLLEAVEAGGLPIESGCRMGMCGADPVCVKEGMEHLSDISDEERATLERLGLAPNTRMACAARVKGPVCIGLKAEKPKVAMPSRVAGFRADPAIGRVVILGNGIAGITAADHVRRRHQRVQIDVVAAEAHHLYNRMGIARLVYGRSAMQGLYLNPDGWYDERSITTWLNTRALEIDRAARTVRLGSGETLSYDKLILATGAQSFVPPIDGVHTPGAFVLRTAEDALRLRGHVQRHGARRAVVAGGGLLGLEAAYALHKTGLHTTVLERGERLLRRQLDARAAQLLREHLEGLGLEIVLGAETRAVDGVDRVRGVRLADGRDLEADVFLVAAGVAPDVELARATGLEIARGVLVDDRMRTSDDAILAAGDVAEFRSHVPGLWPVAVEQAEVAADNAVGGSKTYAPAPPLTMLKVVGVDLTSIGAFDPEPGDDVVALDEGAGRYRKLVVRDGRAVGAILLGASRDVAAVRTAVARELHVGRHLDALRAGRWSVLEHLSGDRPMLAAAPA
jgi:NADPH-dependent 2,4-dienoyl-CoA reductase/sulfur reductase-like enzyme/ferredoxin